MKAQNLKIVPILLVILGINLRLLPHHPNIVPIGAIALFAGVYLPKKWNLLIPILCLLISDYFIGFYGSLMLFVYGSYLLITLLGQIAKKYRVSIVLLSSIVFFIVSNFGVWAAMNWYPHTFGGLTTCYAMGLPFLKKTIVGDFVYTSLLFGGYEIIKYAVEKIFSHDSVVVSRFV